MSSNRKRRSSILKPQKTRNPLSDINLDQPMETTFMRQSRRVSFASSNFIKEFTADPEKNTIWHMSYEEEAAISTDNNSSAVTTQEVLPANSEANVLEDMSLTDPDELNCTKICSFDNSVEEEHIGANELEIPHSGSQIELCAVLGDCNKTNDLHLKHDTLQFCEIVNEQKIQDNITDFKLQNLQFNESFGFANVNMSQPNVPSFIMGQENHCSIGGQLCRTALHDVMDMTQSIPVDTNVDRSEKIGVTKRRTIHFSQQSNDCNMDVTQSVPTYIDMSNKDNASQSKRRTIYFNQSSNNNNMDMTHIIPIETETDEENMLNTKQQTIHFNQVSNYGDMKISQPIPVGMKIINKENIPSTNRRTIHYNQAVNNGDMDITQVIPVGMKICNKENISNTKRQTIHFNQAVNDGDMEMTQSFPAEMRIINKENVFSTNREYISSTKRQTIHFNQATNGDDMEMTQSIPPGMKIINKEHISNMNGEQASSTKRQTIHFNQAANDGDMEMTQSIPPGMKIINKKHISNMNGEQASSTKRQTIHFNQAANGGDMEMTQSIPPGMKIINKQNVSSTNREQICSRNRQTIHFNQVANDGYMEMTQSISAGIKIENKENVPNIKRQSIHFNQITNDDYMEITQAIPAGVKIVNQQNVQRANVCNVNRQTIHFNEAASDMEVTQAIAAGMNMTNKANISNTKRQTIHFNQTADHGNMEMTQAIPPGITIINKENTSCTMKENVCNTKRQTIHFSEIEHDDNIVMAQSIPAGMKIVSTGNISNTKRQTIHFNQATDTGDMEMTQAIPAGMKIVGKENTSNTKRQTIHFNQATDTGDMEMTQAIPAEMKIVGKENISNTKHQTIHFNQATDTGDMEMTQAISAGLKIINKENVPRENVSNAKIHTINFNQISNDDNMDITLDIPAENRENKNIITQDMHVGLKTNFEHVSNLNRQTVNISQTSNDFVTIKSRSAGLIPIDNAISQPIPSANKLSNRLNSVLGSEMNTIKSNNYLDEITKSVPSGSRLLLKQDNLLTKALLLNDEWKSTDCNTELEKSYRCNDLSNVYNVIDTQQQRRPTDNAYNYNMNYTQTVLPNVDVLENMEQIEYAASNTFENQYIRIEKRQVPFHLKGQPILMDSNKKVLTNASMNEDICIRIRYPNQSDECLSFNSSKMNLTPAPSIHEQTTFNLSKNLSSYIDNTERLINYKTDGNPTSDYSKIINDDLNVSVLKSNISENNRQDISYNEQSCSEKEVRICDENGVDVTKSSDFEHNTFVDDAKEENCHKSETVCKIGHKRISDEMIDNISEIPHKIDRIVNVPKEIINFDERIDITDIIDCEHNDDKSDSVVLVNSSSESECDLSNEKRNVSGLVVSCSDAKNSMPSNFAHLTSNATNVSQSCENSLNSFVAKSAPHSETILCENVSLIESVSSDCSDDSESACDLPKNNRNDLELDMPCFHAKISMPPNIANLVSNKTSLSESYENSLKSFVEKSVLNSETLLCESVSLIESVSSDCSDDDFAAVSFGAKQVKKLINKSVVDSDMTEGVENTDVYKTKETDLIINRVKTLLENICSDIDLNIAVELVEEKSMEMPTIKKSDTFKERFCKLFKNPDALDETVKKELTLEEKIKEKSKDTLWNIIQLHNEQFTFTFLYDTIEFLVYIDRDTEIVKTVEFFSRFCESTSHPSAIFVYRILKKKLSQNHIKSACGQKYNILSLLDYITIIGEQMLDILNEFDDLALNHGLIIDSDLNATFCLTNLFLRIALEVTINISNIDNVSEEEINVKALVGNVRELDVKRLAKGCPQGLPFLRAYILSVEEYLRILQNAKQSRMRK